MWPGYAESKALRCQHSHRFDVAKYYSMTRKYLLYAALACARGPGAGRHWGSCLTNSTSLVVHSRPYRLRALHPSKCDRKRE